jgi:TetR/AcrR family transcriptional regulator
MSSEDSAAADPEPGPPAVAGERRERILEAATDAFAEKGLAGVRVDDIAARSRSNKQLIYYYFGSKVELFDAVLARMIARTNAFWRQANPDMTYRDRMRDLIRAQSTRGMYHWRRMMVWEAVEYGATQIPRHDDRVELWVRRVDALRHAQAAGEIDPSLDPQMVVLMVYSMTLMPHILPQVTELVAGAHPDDEAFEERLLAFADELAARLAPPG